MYEIFLQIFPSIPQEYFGFSVESTKKASYSGDSGQADLNNDSSEDPSDCEKPSCGNEGYTRIESGSKRIGSGLRARVKEKEIEEKKGKESNLNQNH